MEVIQKAAPVTPPPEFFGSNTEKHLQDAAHGTFAAKSLTKALRSAVDSSEWMSEGACYGDEEAAHLLADGSTHEQHQGIKTYCTSCPVSEECLVHALAYGESEGVWGGLTPTQRTRLMRSRFRRQVK